MRRHSAKWVPKCLNAGQKRQRCQSSEQLLQFFRRDPNDFLSGATWWQWTKCGYITVTRKQSNNHWSGGIEAHPATKKLRVKKSAGKFSPRCFGIKTASSSLIILQRAKLSTRSITHLCWCNWGHFEGKTPREVHQARLVLARQCPGSPATCNPEETGLPGLPVSWSPTLFSGSGPFGLPPVLWTGKSIERSPFFFRSEGYCCRGDLVGRTISDFFLFVWLSKVRTTG